jgi:hypothetical protein
VDGDTGAWEFVVLDPARWTLRAFAPGFPAKSMRLAGLPADRPIDVTLEPGRTVRVVVRHADGRPLSGRHAVNVGCLVDRPSLSLLPLEDSAIRPDLWQGAEVPPDGALTLTIGVPDPAYVEYAGQFLQTGMYADPERRMLVPGVERVEFVLRPTCSIVLDVRDERTGRPPELLHMARLLLEDERTGKRIEPRLASVLGYRTATGENDLTVSTWTPLPPGRYAARVVARGWREWERKGIDLERPGARATLDVRLTPDAEVGRLRVSADPAPAPPEGIYAAVRRSGTQGAWTVGQAWATGLAPGAYDVLVFTMSERHAGSASSVPVAADETAGVSVRVGPGLDVSLREGVPEGAAIRRVTLRSREMGSLPVFQVEGSARGGRTDDFSNGPPDRDVVLGPYPVAEVRVEVEGWDGTSYAWTVTR